MGKEAEGVDTVETSRAFALLACNGTNIWEEHPNAIMEPNV